MAAYRNVPGTDLKDDTISDRKPMEGLQKRHSTS